MTTVTANRHIDRRRLLNGTPEFHSTRPPTAEQLHCLLNHSTLHESLDPPRCADRGGEDELIYLVEIEMEVDSVLTPLQSAACTYRIALVRRAGQKVLTLRIVPA